jgi:hypothetical protein
MSINAATTRIAIIKIGFITILDLIAVWDKDLDKLPKHASQVLEFNPLNQVCVPFLSLKKLKAIRPLESIPQIRAILPMR